MLKARLESRLNRIWYEGQRPGRLLRWLEAVYARLSKRRSRLLEQRSASDLEQRPIIVVGNVTVGGTGKTPLVVRLCELLLAAGIKPGVVSRGYGRRSRDLILLEPGTPVEVSGDEPRLIADRTGVSVAVGEDRVAAARLLFQQGVDIVVSDDGLQRMDFPRVYEICVVDGQRGLGNHRLLPAGPLREDPDRLMQVDSVIVSSAEGELDLCVDTTPMRMMVGDPVRLKDRKGMPVESWLANAGSEKVLAVAGIGHPEKFFDSLKNLGVDFEPRAFPDHHHYTAADFQGLERRRLIMTEKDAVKCGHLELEDAWFLPVSAILPEAWENEFTRMVSAFVEQSRDS